MEGGKVEMSEMDKAMRLLTTGIVISAMAGGEYSGTGMRLPRGKPQRGHMVGCHICGATWGTLYKDGDQRICRECRRKKEEGQNG